MRWTWYFGLWLIARLALADPVVEVDQRDNVFQVSAQLTVAAERAVVWQVITDYLRYPEFFPNVRSTRVLERQGNRLVLEQSGESQFLFARVPLDTVMEIEETPPFRLRCNSIAGSLRIVADIELKTESDRTRLLYTSTITLDGWAPSVIVKRDIRRQLEAIRAESLRRMIPTAP